MTLSPQNLAWVGIEWLQLKNWYKIPVKTTTVLYVWQEQFQYTIITDQVWINNCMEWSRVTYILSWEMVQLSGVETFQCFLFQHWKSDVFPTQLFTQMLCEQIFIEVS